VNRRCFPATDRADVRERASIGHQFEYNSDQLRPRGRDSNQLRSTEIKSIALVVVQVVAGSSPVAHPSKRLLMADLC
jgi:hypothetical protein